MIRYSPNSVTVYPKTVRLDIQLSEPDGSSYNSLSYAKLVNLELGKDNTSSDLLGLTTEDTYDRFKDYEEESYIDNTEVYRDTLPAGKEPELGGFYVNTGKLKLKSNFATGSSANKLKKEGKKKISKKTKVVKTKIIQKKESVLPKVKKSKSESTKISVNDKMYNDIRLDALLKAIRKQERKGIVKSINMPDTSKHSLVTDVRKNEKEYCNITPKEKVHSSEKCTAETSVSTKIFLNKTEVSVPKEDFISSKVASFSSRNSTSDSDEIEIVKEIIHSVYKNNNEHVNIQNNINPKTTVTSESVQVATNALISPSNIIPTELNCPSLGSTFVSSSPILDSQKALSTYIQADVPKKKSYRSFSPVAVEPDFITYNASFKTAKPLRLPKATISKNIDSSRKDVTDSRLVSNNSLPATVERSNYSKEINVSAGSNPSKEINASACRNSSKTSKVMKRSSSSKGNMKPVHSSSKETVKPAGSSSKGTVKPARSSSKGTVKPARSSSSKGTFKPVRSSSSKSPFPKEEFHSACKSATGHVLFQDVPLKAPKSKSTKATIKPVNSSSSNAIISSVHHSNSPKTPISKEVPYLSSKIVPDPAFNANSPLLNAEVRSIFSKATTPKEALLSICAAEYAIIKDVTSTKPTGNIIANKKDSSTVNPRDPRSKSTSPKAVSKNRRDVIHDKSARNIPSNTISALSSKSQNSVYYYDNNNLVSDKGSIRTYSKADKNWLQPKVKANPAATSSVAVSQTQQTTVMNPIHSSYNTSEVKMYKMNISPIVKYQETRGKF